MHENLCHGKRGLAKAGGGCLGRIHFCGTSWFHAITLANTNSKIKCFSVPPVGLLLGGEKKALPDRARLGEASGGVSGTPQERGTG